MKEIKKITFLTLLCSSLTGCIFVAGATAGVATTAVIYDQRDMETIRDDYAITHEADQRIAQIPSIHQNSHIVVASFNRVVLLLGQTPDAAIKNAVETTVRTISGVHHIYNEIRIEAPSSGLIQTNDAWITTKVKALMLATPELRSSMVKVITENGDVYLLGVTTYKQAKIAADVARRVKGVKKVIKAFEYIDDHRFKKNM